MPHHIAPQLRPLKCQIKALCTTDKALHLYHYCSVVDSLGLYPMEDLLLQSILCRGGFWVEQSKTEPLKEECHESEDFVDLVIKKHFPRAKPCSEKNVRRAVVFPPPSSLIFIQRYCPSSPMPWWRSRGRWGNLLLLPARKFKPALFVTTSSLIPTFLLLSVLEEAILCLQMPRKLSLKGKEQ